jgi:hypothetical protein
MVVHAPARALRSVAAIALLLAAAPAAHPTSAEDEQGAPPPSAEPPGAARDEQPPPPPGGSRGPGGPAAPERKLLEQFDADDSGWLDAAERAAAREFMRLNPPDDRRGGPGRGRGGRGSRGPGREEREPATPGPRVSPDDVATFPGAALYDPAVLRTIFLEFESADWEAELSDFYNTDVDVPATLVVDGARHPGAGVHFRGASSYFMVPAGSKRSLNVSMDLVDPGQRLCGVMTLNLLNSAGDPSFMSSILYSHIARQHIPAPRANLAKVVINGESWGVFVNVQQFNREFLAEHYPSSAGARWKVKGRPNGESGLDYVGDDLDEYRRRYEIKSKDDEDDWKDLIELCRVLSTAPIESLEASLAPILDIDGVLWFLALDNVLVNSDGYWVRASDYSIFEDGSGVFHLVPHDMNEAFAGALGGPGGRGRPAGPGAAERRPGWELDPLVGMDDPGKPLRSRLLAVPSLRARYLEHVRRLAEESLDWTALGPVVAQHRALIEAEVAADTRKLSSLEAFRRATADDPAAEDDAGAAPRRAIPLRTFVERRRAFLLAHPEVAGAAAGSAAGEGAPHDDPSPR